MPVILQIETATEVCSCALSHNGKILTYKENRQGQTHARLLGVFVDETMRFLREKGLRLDAVSVSSGPGSYTGLRIGVSEAKGVSYALNVPLIAIPTHLLMASMMKERREAGEWLCPMLDARRMEVYTAFFDSSMNLVRPTSADVVNEESYLELLDRHRILFFGNGAEKCREVILHPNARFATGIKPDARAMAPLSESAFRAGDFVDTAYFEPFYLKEFVATVPKKPF